MEMIKQIRISPAMQFFRDKILTKYNLAPYFDKNKPAAFFGMYRDEDIKALTEHNSKAVVIWCGSDSLITLPKQHNKIKALKNVKHIAMSGFIESDLRKYGINSEILAITPTTPIKNRKNRGDNIYIYVDKAKTEKYGYNLLDEIISKCDKNIIVADNTTYTREQLQEIYKSCFIGLRLTKHDGLPNTVVEMGLMGRMCVYNGKLPNAIPFTDVNSIVNIINSEYNKRHENNQEITDSVYNYLNINNDWLKID